MIKILYVILFLRHILQFSTLKLRFADSFEIFFVF